MGAITGFVFTAILGIANAQDTIGFGPYFSLGPTQSWIRQVLIVSGYWYGPIYQ